MRRTTPLPRLAYLCAGIAALVLGAARADDADPPGRVALVDLVDGAAAAQPAGGADWVADLANLPLTTGDKLWVDAASRAELHLGAAAIRLGAGTGIQFLDVSDQVAQLRLSAGSMNVRLRYLSPDETFEVDTPNTAVTFLQPGEYRIDVDQASDAVAVTVWQGQAEVAGEAQSFTLYARQQGHFQGQGVLDVQFGDLPPPDALDQWAAARDQREDAALSANFLSRDVQGYETLDSYGTWQTDPVLGAVWTPEVDADWAPYSQGYWTWIAPWGWTWIDAAPWGFAPSHYGRWIHRPRGWGWVPGQLSVHPVYAPALVVWASGSAGEVAWFALGYNEIYRPSRAVSNDYLQRVNVTNTYLNTTISIDAKVAAMPQRYANRQVRGAVIAMARDSFTAGAPVRRIVPAQGGEQLVTTVTNAIAPPAHARAGAGRGRAAIVPPRAVFARHAVARTALPAALARSADARRITVTQVAHEQALRRTSVPSAAPQPLATPHGGTSRVTHSRPPPAGIASAPSPAGAAGGQPPPAAPLYRTDRPAVMPHPSNDRALTPPAEIERESVERDVRETRTEHAPENPAPAARPAPAPRREPVAEPARKAPERNEH